MYNKLWVDEGQITKSLNEKLVFKKHVFDKLKFIFRWVFGDFCHSNTNIFLIKLKLFCRTMRPQYMQYKHNSTFK